MPRAPPVTTATCPEKSNVVLPTSVAHLGGAPAKLRERDVLDVRGDVPLVAERRLVDLQRPGRVVDDQVRREGGMAGGDRVDHFLRGRTLRRRALLLRLGLHDRTPFRSRNRRATAACMAMPVASADSFSS